MQRSGELSGEHILVLCGETSNFPLNRNPLLCSPDPQSQSALSRVLSRSVVSNSVTPWTVATGLLCPWDFPGKKIGVGCHFLLQGNLPDPGVELVSCFGRRILYHLSRQGSPRPERWLSLKHQGTGIPSQLSALHPQGRQKITACTCQASGTGCGKDWDSEKESQFQVLRNGLGSSCFQLPVPGLGRWGGQCCLCRRVCRRESPP